MGRRRYRRTGTIRSFRYNFNINTTTSGPLGLGLELASALAIYAGFAGPYKDRGNACRLASAVGSALGGLAGGALSLGTGPLAVFGTSLAFSLAGSYLGSHLAGYIADRLGLCDPVSPLILDLDGDGVEADALAYFDHQGDGWKELSRWANEDDGVLVWDRNSDGIINDGSELFGNNTVLSDGSTADNGFTALADLDTNGDGKVDAADATWAELRVMRWTDANDDGIVQDDEKSLVTLESLGVSSLATGFANSNHVDELGNEHRQEGSYTKTDGTTVKMTDVWLVTVPGMTNYDRSDIPAHSTVIAALPDFGGDGRVYDLHDAMALDDATDSEGNSRLTAPYYGNDRTETRSLREMVAAFVETDANGHPLLDKAEREVLAEKILLRWTGAEGARAGDYGASRSSYTQAHKIAVLEAFQGEQWRGGKAYRNPAYKTAQKVERGYRYYLEKLYGQLMMSSHLSDLSEAVALFLNEGAEIDSTNPRDYILDFSAVETMLTDENDARRGEWLRSMAAVYGNSDLILSAMRATAPDWVYEYEYYAEYLERGVFDGNRLRQNDFVGDCGCSGGLRDNVFQTTDGGADRLEGRGGDDIYHLGYGTGHDRIEEKWRDSDWNGDANDVIKIAPGVGTDLVRLSRTRDDLIVTLYNADGTVDSSLTVSDHYSNPLARVEWIMFSDGTIWNADELSAVLLSSGQGSVGDDTYDGAVDGKDLLLQGGKGSDVYLFGRNSGNDVIDEASYSGGVNSADGDVIRLKEGLTAADISLSRTRYDLIVKVLSADGISADSTLTVKNYYVNDMAKIEGVELSDGTPLFGPEHLQAAIYADGSSGNDTLIGTSGSETFSGFNGGDDTFHGGGGSDVYLFGRGSGNDIIDEALYNSGANSADRDVIRLKEGLTVADVSLSRTRYDLVINVLSADGISVDSTLTVKNYYVNDMAKIERVELSDGTPLFGPEHLQAAIYADGSSGNDTLIGTSGSETFSGFNGGDDTFHGGGGSDVYLFGRGIGNDVIDEEHQNFGSLGDVVRLQSGIALSSVSLSRNSHDLVINLRDNEGNITDTLTVRNYYVSDAAKIERVELSDGALLWNADDFVSVSWIAPVYADSATEIVGGIHGDYLHGLDATNDVFDSDGGGKDYLRGLGGDDVYWLGEGTGNDIIQEYYLNDGDAGDVIKIKSGIEPGSVNLARSNDGNHLYVQLLDDEGAVTDSLQVQSYFSDVSARIERVEFTDGTVWDANDFAVAQIVGGIYGDYLHGLDATNDVFDSDGGGKDYLRGLGGDDVYWLGEGTGNDIIQEYYLNDGDAGDVIKIKSGIEPGSVNLARSNDGNHLYVQLLDDEGAVTDSLQVQSYFSDVSARIERVEFADGTVWDANDFAVAQIVRGIYGDYLYGLDATSDVFDSDGGGKDTLRGYGGDDVYWFGEGTGDDIIQEYYLNDGDAGDVIKIKSGIEPGSVNLARSNDGNHLYVQLLDDEGAVTDSLQVQNYFSDVSARVERVEFADGTVWDANDFAVAEIVGGNRNDYLYGLDATNDVFDSDGGGKDTLRGYGGDDVYWLGEGTGDDIIQEYYLNDGDAGDVIKIKSGIEPGSVNLARSNDGNHLYVQLLDDEGAVTDSLQVQNYFSDASARVERVEFADGTVWDANDFAVAEIVGGNRNDYLYGLDATNDVFDSDGGGKDTLRGLGGDDVYWLGEGTGDDIIQEYYLNDGDAGDVIKIKSGIEPGSVNLARSNDGNHLYVQLLDDEGAVTDSLQVQNYFSDASARVERVEFADGTVWDANDFAVAQIVGGIHSDYLHGLDATNDVFDSDGGGKDTLRGLGGDDVYWLGEGTGDDIIQEHYNNDGDAGDVIRIKSDISLNDVSLHRSGNDLYVQLLDDEGEVTDSLKVQSHFSDDTAKVESIEAGGKVLLESQYQHFIDALAAFEGGNRNSFATEQALYNHYWEDAVSLGSSSS